MRKDHKTKTKTSKQDEYDHNQKRFHRIRSNHTPPRRIPGSINSQKTHACIKSQRLHKLDAHVSRIARNRADRHRKRIALRGTIMTATEYRTIRKQLGLTQAGLAALLCETRETISRRERSEGFIPMRDTWALRWLAEHMEQPGPKPEQ